METIAKADIFFFITTIAVVIVTIFLTVFLWYLIRAFKKISKLCDGLEKDIYTVGTEAKEIITHLKESLIFKLLFMGSKNRKKQLK